MGGVFDFQTCIFPTGFELHTGKGKPPQPSCCCCFFQFCPSQPLVGGFHSWCGDLNPGFLSKPPRFTTKPPGCKPRRGEADHRLRLRWTTWSPSFLPSGHGSCGYLAHPTLGFRGAFSGASSIFCFGTSKSGRFAWTPPCKFAALGTFGDPCFCSTSYYLSRIIESGPL